MYLILFIKVENSSDSQIFIRSYEKIQNFYYHFRFTLRDRFLIVEKILFCESFSYEDESIFSIFFKSISRYEYTILCHSPYSIFERKDRRVKNHWITQKEYFYSIRIESIDLDFFYIFLILFERLSKSFFIEEDDTLTIYLLYRSICKSDIDRLVSSLDDDLRWTDMEIWRVEYYIE